MMSEPILTVKNVSKRYGEFRVLEDVSLSVHPGEVRALIGPNGAGKSTLLKAISGEAGANDGVIAFRGSPITHLPPHQIRHLGIARSFQSTQIMPGMTVLEQLKLAVQSFTRQRYSLWNRFSPNEELDSKAFAMLELVDMAPFSDQLASALSYADQRKLELALVLVGQPSLLLLDEPTAGMSVEESQRFALLIKRLCQEQGVTLVIVEHDMNVVFQISHQITVLSRGRVLCEGPAHTVMANAEVQKVYMGG